MSHAYRARLVIPVDSPPLWDGCVEFEEGVITAVHERSIPGAADLGNVAILPGLINSHTHLEFSDLDQPLGPAKPFTAWLRSVVADRRSKPWGGGGDQAARLSRGAEESRADGVAAIGDIATAGWTPDAFSPDAPLIVAFRECLGLRPERVEPQLVIAREHLERCRRIGASASLNLPSPPSGGEGPGVRGGSASSDIHLQTQVQQSNLLPARPPSPGLWPPSPPTGGERDSIGSNCQTRAPIIGGLSPHAPYTVHPELLRGVVELAVSHDAPLAMHLAETPAEIELLDRASGEFVEFLASLGAWDPQAIPRGSRVLDYLHALSPAKRVLVVHGNYLSADEIDFLAVRPQFTVVYCPRTHAYFGHAPHPWRELLARGVRVVLGTDSRASNPDLSIWSEAKYLAERFPDVSRETLLRMITRDAAMALGLNARLGSLAPGKAARFAVVPLPERKEREPYTALFGVR